MSELLNELRWFSTTLNVCPNPRELFGRASDEIARLTGLQAPVICFDCKREIQRAGEWFRCFDCGMHLCRDHVTKHFGDQYTPHHRRMESLSRVECRHTDATFRGADAPRAYGSDRTEVCLDCGMYCRTDHHGKPLSAWLPAAQYAKDTARSEDAEQST